MATSTAPSSETTLRRPEPPRFHSGKTFFWAIVLILGVGFLAWLLIGHFGEGNFEDLDQKRVKERQDILQKRNAEDARLLNDPPSYLDKDKGKIRVPITEAMKLALPALKADQPHAAYPMTGDHLPLPAAAPTSPDKGAGSPKDGNINPSASNPTLPPASPGAVPAAGQSPTPVPPGTTATPPPAGAPTPGATPQVGTAATSTPPPPPATNNNALNPGNPPPNGAQGQPSPAAPGNTETNGGSPTPSGAQPQPLTNPTPQPTPPTASSENTPSPDPKEPGATPGGTP